MHASRKGRLDSLRVVAVPCEAVGDEVAGLSALEASAFGLTIIHVGTLFIHGLTVDVFFLWGCRCSSWHGRTWGWLPRARTGWGCLMLKFAGLKLPFVGIGRASCRERVCQYV